MYDYSKIVKNRQKNNRWLIALLMFMTPFCYPFRIFVGHIIHLHVYVVMYLTIFILCGISLVFCKTIMMTRPMMLMLLLYVAMLWISPDIDTGMKWIINVISGILLANLLNVLDFRPEDCLSYACGTVVCGMIMQPDIVRKLPLDVDISAAPRVPFMDGDISIGPNSWAVTATICLLLLLILFLCSNNVLYRFVALVFIIMLSLQIYETKSRTEVYAGLFCVALAVYRWFIRKNSNRLYQALVFLCTMVFAGIICVLVLEPSYVFSGDTRLTELDFNGRLEIWRTCFHTFCSMNPIQYLFGCGTGGAGVYNYIKSAEYFVSLQPVFVGSYTDHISPHNSFLDALISTGIFGFALVVFYYARTAVVMFRKEDTAVFVIPLFLMIAGLGIHFFNSWDYCVIIAVTEYYYIKRKNQTDKVLEIRVGS